MASTGDQPPFPRQPAEDRTLPRPLAIFGALYFLVLLVYGWLYHPIPSAGAEVDGFIHHAEYLLSGRLPRDPFRPLLYPLTVAGLAWFLGDAFVAARIISSAATAALLLGTYRLALSCCGRNSAILATALLAVNGTTIVNGVQAITDPLFAALTLWTVNAAIAAHRSGSTRSTVLLGMLFALSFFTRYTAVALLVPIALALLLASPNTRLRRLFRLGTFAASVAVFLVPHFIASYLTFGKIHHDENWRNMALKYFSDFDFHYLFATPFNSLLSVIAHDPLYIMTRGLQDIWRCLTVSLGHTMVGYWDPWIWILPLIALLGTLFAFMDRFWSTLIAFSFAATYIVILCVTFIPFDRMLLPVLPFVLAPLGRPFDGIVNLLPFPRAAKVFCRVCIGLLFLLLLASPTPAVLRAFEASHPHEEVAVARALGEHAGRPMVMLASYPFMQRYVQEGITMRRSGWGPRESPDEAYRALHERARATGAEFVILGRLTLFASWASASRAAIPPGFRVHERTENVIVLRVLEEPHEPSEAPSLRIQPNPFRGGQLRLDVDLPEGEKDMDGAQFLLEVTDPSGNRSFLALGGMVGGTFHWSLELEGVERGVWKLVGHILRRDGSVVGMRMVEWRVEDE